MTQIMRNCLQERRSGILLHPTSLPGNGLNGELGPNAYWFVDFLVNSGFRLWQTLPLNPPHADLSPYQSQSVHAGNPALISLELLQQSGWLKQLPNYDKAENLKQINNLRQQALENSWKQFQNSASQADHDAYQQFCEEHGYWLNDYVLFALLKQQHQNKAWWQWSTPLRQRQAKTLQKLQQQHQKQLEYQKFIQYLFFSQWLSLKKYANQRNIQLFGDLPIFVAADSVDVWSQQESFLLDEKGMPSVVAGVPPDYFSETGQLWGNPHYNWKHMQENGFEWWLQRLQTQNILFDIVRIDHFRGFEAYWEIPANAPTAIDGHWVKAPGEALFDRLMEVDSVPLVAEDLGVITAEVTALRKRYQIPGMKILQFAFDGGANNPYLPHNYSVNSVVYTGTHDNDTTLGWFKSLEIEQRQHVCDYLNCDEDDMPWPMIRAVLASTADLAIIPMQDLLELDSKQRMNRPGTINQENWRWRFEWEQINSELHHCLWHLQHLYGRC